MKPKYIAIDDSSMAHFLWSDYPRKELLAGFGRKHAEKMYRGNRHVGYVIAEHWLEIFKVEPWKK